MLGTVFWTFCVEDKVQNQLIVFITFYLLPMRGLNKSIFITNWYINSFRHQLSNKLIETILVTLC